MENGLKRIVISEKCVGCGVCIGLSEWIKETPEGLAIPKGGGVISGGEVVRFNLVMENCMEGAIFLEDAGRTEKDGSLGLKELRDFIVDELFDYELGYPGQEYYCFDKEAYKVPIPYSPNQRQYKYKSDDRAEREGLSEFDRIMFREREILVQQVLVQYKNKMLSQFWEYQEEQGKYYYDVIRGFYAKLSEYAMECKQLGGDGLDLSVDYLEMKIQPVFGRAGDKIDREMNVYRIKHIEEIISYRVVNELESLGWYSTYVNYDDREVYNGRKEVDMYCYDLTEVCATLAKYILSETAFVLNNSDGAERFVGEAIEAVNKQMMKDMNDVVLVLVNCINRLLGEDEMDEGSVREMKLELVEVEDKEVEKEQSVEEWLDELINDGVGFNFLGSTLKGK